MLEERDGTFVVRGAGIMVQPFMQCGTRSEDGKQHNQRNATAGQQPAEQRRSGVRAVLEEYHEADWID